MKTKSTGSTWGSGIGVILLVVVVHFGLAWVRTRWHAPTNAEIQQQKWDVAADQMRKLSADLDRQTQAGRVMAMDRAALAKLLNPSPSPKVDDRQNPFLQYGLPSPSSTLAADKSAPPRVSRTPASDSN